MKIIKTSNYKKIANNYKRELALKLLDWHGGQGSDLYSVGSSWLANHDVPNDVINGLMPLLDYEDIEKPPYNLKSFNNVGAHISVIGIDEYNDNNIEEIEELGEEFNFTFKDFKRTNPDGWDEMKQVYFVVVDAPELKKLRKKYKLTELSHGHQFHITIGIEKK